MRRLKLSLIIPALAAMLALPLFAGNIALAVDENSINSACEGIGAVGEDCNTGKADDDINDLIAAAVNILSWLVGIAAVFMIIIAGFKYISANGDANSISSAKTTLVYALIGLAVAAVAQLLVQFVLNQTTTDDPLVQEEQQIGTPNPDLR